MQGPNRDAVLVEAGTEAEPTVIDELPVGSATPVGGAFVSFNGTVTHVEGGEIYWGNGQFRPTALPERWHLDANGAVDAGE